MNDEAETKQSGGGSQMTYRSKSFKDGEELLSEDSYLFQWKPDYIAKQEQYIDRRKDRFVCVQGSTGRNKLRESSTTAGKQKPLNDEIITQIEKLHKYYEAQNDKGRAHGYRRALTALRSYDKPIHSAEQL